MQIDEMQAAIREQGLDGWLFYDHHHRDPIAGRVLGLDPAAHVTRRWYYFVPAIGEAQKLVHRIESFRLDALPGTKRAYSSWQELAAELEAMLVGARRIAMQYSPRNAILYVSMVDAGTVEFLREIGKEIVSSADLVSRFEAVLSEQQMASHAVAQRAIDAILLEAWREIGTRVRPASGLASGMKSGMKSGPASRVTLDAASELTEYAMMQWLAEALRREGLVWENGPNVSVGPNSADSHYEPTAERSRAIRNGDFLLIDIWGRQETPLRDGKPAIHYDVTWTGVIGREPNEREQTIFAAVTAGRDAAIQTVEDAFRDGRAMRGFEADRAARRVIDAAGYGAYFTHRTGHNISADLHGTGAHLDDLETHDERLILPRTCFSVEPGIYLPGEFGVRSEVNMLTDTGRAWVTGARQRELVRI